MVIGTFPKISGLLKRKRGSAEAISGLGEIEELIILNPIAREVVETNLEHSFFWDTLDGANPFVAGTTIISAPPDFEVIYYKVMSQVMNRTGATQTYRILVYNATTGEILIDTDDKFPGGIEVDHLGGLTINSILGKDKISVNDTIMTLIMKGVIGTIQTSASFAKVQMHIDYLVDAKKSTEWIRTRQI